MTTSSFATETTTTNHGYEMPPWLRPVSTERLMTVKGEVVDPKPVPLLDGKLYTSTERLDGRERWEKDGFKVRPGAILTRNSRFTREWAKKQGVDPTDPANHVFACYDDIHAAIRGLSRVGERYRRIELPRLDETLSAMNDLWMLVPELENGSDFHAALFSAFAFEQAVCLDRVTNDHKLAARATIGELTDRTGEAASIEVPRLIQKIEAHLKDRVVEMRDIEDEMADRVEILCHGRATYFHELEVIGMAARRALRDQRYFGPEPDQEASRKLIDRLCRFLNSILGPTYYPRPFDRHFRHVKLDVTTGVEALDHGNQEVARAQFAKICASTFLVKTRKRGEEAYAMISQLVHQERAMSEMALRAFSDLVQNMLDSTAVPGFEDGFEKPVLDDFREGLKATRSVIAEQGPKDVKHLKRVKEAFRAPLNML